MEQARAADPPQAKPGRKKKIRPEPVVIRTGKVSYVDEYGDDLPDFTAEAMMPVWMGVGLIVKRMDMEPFDKDELSMLAEASAPVAQKWGGVLLPFMAELTLVGAVVAVMWPRVSDKHDRDMKRAQATKDARPLRNPAAPPAPSPAPKSEVKATPAPGGVILPETRLS